MSQPKPIENELTVTISEWARYTIWALQQEIVKRKIGRTGALLRGFEHKIKTASDGSISGVTIGFMYHGKFVDMGVGKGIKLEDVKGNAEKWRALTSEERRGIRRRRPNKWYSPTMYYEYQRLAEILRERYALTVPVRFEYTLSEKIQVSI